MGSTRTPILERVSGEQFRNVSPLTFRKLLNDLATLADNLRAYIVGFSQSARDVIDDFGFNTQITRLDNAPDPGCMTPSRRAVR